MANIQKIILLTLFLAFLLLGFQVFAAECNSSGWNNSDCTVDIYYGDPGGGSDLAECKFGTLNGTPPLPSCSTVENWDTACVCGGASTTCNGINITIGSGGKCSSQGEGACKVCSKAVDTAGNEGYCDDIVDNCLSLNIDYTLPETAIECDSTTCSASWYNADISITLLCSDSHSGCDKTYYCVGQIDSCDPDPTVDGIEYTGAFTLTTEGTNYVKYYSIDIAGNIEQPTKSQTIKLDKNDLSGTLTISPMTVQVDETFTVSVDSQDSLSGVNYIHLYREGSQIDSCNCGGLNSCSHSWNLTESTEGVYTYQALIYDIAGNSVFSNAEEVTVIPPDTTPPATTLDEYLPDPTNDNTPTCSGASIDTQSQVVDIEYRVDGGSWQDVDLFTPALSVIFTFTPSSLTDGTHTFEVRAQDEAGNWEQSPYSSDTLTIDTTPPTTTISPDGEDWGNSDVDFTLSCDDGTGSGCQATEYKIIDQSQTCDTSDLITGNSGTVTCPEGQTCQKKVCFRSIDNLNQEEPINTSNLFKIDKIDPSGTLEVSPDSPIVGEDITITISANDGESGVDYLLVEDDGTYLPSQDCGGAATCDKSWIVQETVSGDYTYCGLIYDLAANINNTTPYCITITVKEAITPPTVETDPATNIEETSATLNGRVIATGGEDPTRYFKWDTTNNSIIWVSPTGHNDPDNGWNNEGNAYDGDTGTRATTPSLTVGTWSTFLELTHTAINCSKIRFFLSFLTYLLSEVDIDVYYGGAWHDVYQGGYTKDEWIEKDIPAGEQLVTKARFRVKRAYSDGIGELNEFDFGEVSYVNTENCGIGGPGTYSAPISGLSPGEVYYFRAAAENIAGMSYAANEEKFLTKPEPPTNLIATAVSLDEIDLTWTPGQGADYTEVWRKESSCPTARGDGDLLAGTTLDYYNDTGLDSGTTYCYGLWSVVSKEGLTQYSDEEQCECATTIADTTPPATTLDEYLPDPTNDNTPTYSGASTDTQSQVADIEYRVDGGSWLDVDSFTPAPSVSFAFTPSPLVDGTHTFEVRAQDEAGNWEQSPYPSDTLTIDTTPPLTTISPDGEDWGNSDVDFTLSCDDGTGSGCQTTEYKIIDQSQTCDTSDLITGNSGTVTCPEDQTCQKKACFRSIDNLNQEETINTSNLFKVDKINPSGTLEVSPDSPIVEEDITITISANDGESGVDYLLAEDDGTYLPSQDCGGAAICDKSWIVQETVAGDHTYCGLIYDLAANVNNTTPYCITITVTISDDTPPYVEVIADPPEVKTTWQNTDATANVSCSDPDTWTCGDSVTFTYKGSSVTYGTVESQGKCWMDRNLGASRMAWSYNDSLAYGDLFQWGRLDDGHQTRTSGKTTTLSSTDIPGHSNFIYVTSPIYDDWRSPRNDNLWQGVSGTNNPCPSGWRIPAEAEWDTERASWSQQNYIGAFDSPLKLTVGGYRYYRDASLHGMGSYGQYWASTVDGSYASSLHFQNNAADTDPDHRAVGFSVRCIKDSDSDLGCDSASYRLKTYTVNPGTCSTNYADYTLASPQTVSSYQWLCGTAKDLVGNAGFSSPVEFKVDKINPSGALTVSPENPIIGQDITITIVGQDGESGVGDVLAKDDDDWLITKNCGGTSPCNKNWVVQETAAGDHTYCGLVYDVADSYFYTNCKTITVTTTGLVCDVNVQNNTAVVNQWISINVSGSQGAIAEVRFTSNLIGEPAGSWTDWYGWDVSSGDWDASFKIMKWSFAETGNYEVWVELKDGSGNTQACYDTILIMECYPGQTKTCTSFQDCSHTITCQPNGTWPSCPEDQCVSGTTQSCGVNGLQTCIDTCTWGPCVTPPPDGDGCPWPPDISCDICWKPVCNTETDEWECQPDLDAAGTDCGDCLMCDNSGNCSIPLCSGIAESCECIPGSPDSCKDCSDYGIECGYKEGPCYCGQYEYPIWSCDEGECQCYCQEDETGEICPSEPPEECEYSPPIVSIVPDYREGAAGDRLTYTVSVINQDEGVECESSNFILSTGGICDSWNCDLDSLTLTIAPQCSQTTQLHVSSPAEPLAPKEYYVISVAAVNQTSGLFGADEAIYKVLNNPPSAISLSATPIGDCFLNHPYVRLEWSFSDPDLASGDKQSAREVEIFSDPGYINLVNRIPEPDYSPGSTEYAPNTGLSFNATYYWRARVWDNEGALSDCGQPEGWCYPEQPSFHTEKEWPWPYFSVAPLTQRVHLKERVEFTDESTCYDGPCNFSPTTYYLWEFGDGGTSPEKVKTSHIYSATGNYDVTLTITDDIGECTYGPIQIVVTLPLPEWWEIAPF